MNSRFIELSKELLETSRKRDALSAIKGTVAGKSPALKTTPKNTEKCL